MKAKHSPTDITLTDRETGEAFTFKSMRDASKFLDRSNTYISGRIFKGKTTAETNIRKKHSDGKKKIYDISINGQHEIEIDSYKNVVHMRSKRNPQLCSYCKNCHADRCHFIGTFGAEPVEGWKADPSSVFNFYTAEETPTFYIHECPLFAPDDGIVKGKVKLSKNDRMALKPYAEEIEKQQKAYKNSKREFRKYLKEFGK